MSTSVFLKVSDERISEFLIMELGLLGYSVWSGRAADADFVICDARAYASLALKDVRRVAVVLTNERTREPSGVRTVWRWPIPIGAIRSFLRESASGLGGSCETASEHSQKPSAVIDEEARVLCWRGDRIALTERELAIVRLLLAAKGAPVSRECLAATLGGDENVLNVHMCHLRKKLEQPYGVRVLETLRGEGYRLRAELD